MICKGSRFAPEVNAELLNQAHEADEHTAPSQEGIICVRGLCPLHHVCATLLLTVPLPRCFAQGGHPLSCVEDGRVNGNTLHKISPRLLF